MPSKILPLVLLALSQNTLAADPPSAGSQLQQIPAPRARAAPAPAIRLQPARAPAAAAADTATVRVARLRVNAPVFSEAALVAASGVVPGSEMTLAQLRAAAAGVAAYFHQRGYFLAQAYLPAQDITSGEVRITVLPGEYGKVTLRNTSAVTDTAAMRILAGLDGAMIASGPLERRLLLLSDLPGVQASSTLAPGARLGQSDLLVELAPGARVSGSVDADNQGSRYTGKHRVGATVNVNELAGLGDVASARVFTSADGLKYGRLSWQAQAGLATLGAAVTRMDYRLGREFASLDAHGSARIGSVFGSYPLLRSRSANLRAQLGYDAKTFQDRADSTGSVTDKQAAIWVLGLQGDARAASGASGAMSLAVTRGEIEIQSPAALLDDQLAANTNGTFHKLAVSASALQPLTGATSLYAMASLQLASHNLDISEKIGIGGVGGVRAYPGGEAYGDQGHVLNLELRHTLPAMTALPGRWQLSAFADHGSVTLNRHPWSAGPAHRRLSGAGLGLHWSGPRALVVQAHYAHKLGSEKASSAPDADGRFWLQAVKYF